MFRSTFIMPIGRDLRRSRFLRPPRIQKMRTFLRSALLLSLSAGILSGCAAVNEEHQNFANRKIDIVPVVGSIWRITASFPGYESSTGIADYIYERAQAFCGERGMGMMPQTGSSSAAGADGTPAEAWLEFRCSAPEKVDREYQPIKLHFDLEDEDEKKKR